MESAFAFTRPDEQTLEVRLAGDWLLVKSRPSVQDVAREIDARPTKVVKLSANDVGAWDSSIVTFVRAIVEACVGRSIDVDRSELPKGVQRLLALADAVPETEGARRHEEHAAWLARVGSHAINVAERGLAFLEFLGSLTLTLGRFLLFKARYQVRDLWLLIQQCGAQALPIVALIAFIVGLILAFVGSVQLRRFGAQVFVADAVGLGMTREMGALMTGVIMAGRTGAAFAAQLGTMKVNEEVDAFRTLGISPLEYLVLPRMLALCLMMPLLCVFADLIGILGGGVVAVGVLDLQPLEYAQRTIAAISIQDFLVGVTKSAVFGILVAAAGCWRGMRAAGSASAVGEAATAAVVLGIVAIVSADGIFAVLTNVLGL
jgi:phospholipid/cholesterol/gamma-HCH transport system permease protein